MHHYTRNTFITHLIHRHTHTALTPHTQTHTHTPHTQTHTNTIHAHTTTHKMCAHTHTHQTHTSTSSPTYTTIHTPLTCKTHFRHPLKPRGRCSVSAGLTSRELCTPLPFLLRATTLPTVSPLTTSED